jgi:hypothetical protein
MPRTGRPSRQTAYEKISNISVPRETYARVRLLLLDPITGQVRYGKMSQLISRLLADWVERQTGPGGTPTATPIPQPEELSQ